MKFKKASRTKAELLAGSSRAVCGVFEREKIVRVENVESIKRDLKARGFIIVGTGDAGGKFRKIWFSPMGAAI